MKKSLFWTFAFACVPGAGQMYLTYMKRGLSLMTLFFGIGTIIALTRMEELLFIAPIIWAYSFFDTFNIRNASVEELEEMPDKFILNLDDSDYVKKFWSKRHFGIGFMLVVIGTYIMLINTGILPLVITQWVQRYFPTFVITIILIAVGVKFMVGDKDEK